MLRISLFSLCLSVLLVGAQSTAEAAWGSCKSCGCAGAPACCRPVNFGPCCGSVFSYSRVCCKPVGYCGMPPDSCGPMGGCSMVYCGPCGACSSVCGSPCGNACGKPRGPNLWTIGWSNPLSRLFKSRGSCATHCGSGGCGASCRCGATGCSGGGQAALPVQQLAPVEPPLVPPAASAVEVPSSVFATGFPQEPRELQPALTAADAGESEPRVLKEPVPLQAAEDPDPSSKVDVEIPGPPNPPEKLELDEKDTLPAKAAAQRSSGVPFNPMTCGKRPKHARLASRS